MTKENYIYIPASRITELKERYESRIKIINENMDEALKLKDLYEFTKLADHEKIYQIVIEDLEEILSKKW